MGQRAELSPAAAGALLRYTVFQKTMGNFLHHQKLASAAGTSPPRAHNCDLPITCSQAPAGLAQVLGREAALDPPGAERKMNSVFCRELAGLGCMW